MFLVREKLIRVVLLKGFCGYVKELWCGNREVDMCGVWGGIWKYRVLIGSLVCVRRGNGAKVLLGGLYGCER